MDQRRDHPHNWVAMCAVHVGPVALVPALVTFHLHLWVMLPGQSGLWVGEDTPPAVRWGCSPIPPGLPAGAQRGPAPWHGQCGPNDGHSPSCYSMRGTATSTVQTPRPFTPAAGRGCRTLFGGGRAQAQRGKRLEPGHSAEWVPPPILLSRTQSPRPWPARCSAPRGVRLPQEVCYNLETPPA